MKRYIILCLLVSTQILFAEERRELITSFGFGFSNYIDDIFGERNYSGILESNVVIYAFPSTSDIGLFLYSSGAYIVEVLPVKEEIRHGIGHQATMILGGGFRQPLTPRVEMLYGIGLNCFGKSDADVFSYHIGIGSDIRIKYNITEFSTLNSLAFYQFSFSLYSILSYNFIKFTRITENERFHFVNNYSGFAIKPYIAINTSVQYRRPSRE
jgi:hypothetical protein